MMGKTIYEANLSHELQLLDDLLEMFFTRQRVNGSVHVVCKKSYEHFMI